MNITHKRLYSQQLSGGADLKSPEAVVKWMGAMQAQDHAMSKWAVGIRLPGSSEQAVDDAMAAGKILRTHLMRPTWHLVASEDIRWLLGLTAPQIKALAKTRYKELELTPELLKKSNRIIEKALAGENHLPREELMAQLLKSGIRSDFDNRSSHLLMWAELEGIICSGPPKGNKHTYALLDERVPHTKAVPREEALGKLAERYFNSHGPATLADFNWWSGLSVKDARNALEHVKHGLVCETVGEESYLLSQKSMDHSGKMNNAFLLPAYDEFIISYKNRSAILNAEEHKKAVSVNGLFRPVIVIEGKVKGLWKRTVKKDKVIIETDLFEKLTVTEAKNLEAASASFEQFILSNSLARVH